MENPISMDVSSLESYQQVQKLILVLIAVTNSRFKMLTAYSNHQTNQSQVFI